MTVSGGSQFRPGLSLAAIGWVTNVLLIYNVATDGSSFGLKKECQIFVTLILCILTTFRELLNAIFIDAEQTSRTKLAY